MLVRAPVCTALPYLWQPVVVHHFVGQLGSVEVATLEATLPERLHPHEAT